MDLCWGNFPETKYLGDQDGNGIKILISMIGKRVL